MKKSILLVLATLVFAAVVGLSRGAAPLSARSCCYDHQITVNSSPYTGATGTVWGQNHGARSITTNTTVTFGQPAGSTETFYASVSKCVNHALYAGGGNVTVGPYGDGTISISLADIHTGC